VAGGSLLSEGKEKSPNGEEKEKGIRTKSIKDGKKKRNSSRRRKSYREGKVKEGPH